jgi:undecaprenyl-diphosphatase
MKFLQLKFLEFSRDITSLSSPLILGLFFLLLFADNVKILVLVIFSFLVNEIICSLVKYFFFRPRPEPMKWKTWWEKIEASTFPSIHSSRAGLMAVWVMSQSTYLSSFQQVVVLMIMLLVALSRVVLKKHFYIDIICGLVIGAIIGGIFIRYLM